MLMTSMTGQTTLVGSSATLSKRGSSQSALHSQCESRNVNTLAVAASAPRTLDLIKPSLFSLRITRTLCILDSSSPSSAARKVGELSRQRSMHSPRCKLREKSSTRGIRSSRSEEAFRSNFCMLKEAVEKFENEAEKHRVTRIVCFNSASFVIFS